jgi:hypothetical protein
MEFIKFSYESDWNLCWKVLCWKVLAQVIMWQTFIVSVLRMMRDLRFVFTCVVLQDNCMVCGIDSFHDTTKKGGSVAGFVSSLNKTFTRWFSRVCFQGHGQELVDGLKTCFISALKCYHEVSIELMILHVASRCRYGKLSSWHIWKIWKNLAQ